MPWRSRLQPSRLQRGSAPEVTSSLPSCLRAWPEVTCEGRPSRVRSCSRSTRPSPAAAAAFPQPVLSRGLPRRLSQPRRLRFKLPLTCLSANLTGLRLSRASRPRSSAGLTALDAPCDLHGQPQVALPSASRSPRRLPAQAHVCPQVWSEQMVLLSGLHLTFSLLKGALHSS